MISTKEYIPKFQEWLGEATSSLATAGKERTWAMMSYFGKSLTKANIIAFFERVALNDRYVAIVESKSGKHDEAYGQIELEINNIFGFQKGFAARHKTRLQYYEDDLSNKGHRTVENLTQFLAQHEKFVAVREGGTGKPT